MIRNFAIICAIFLHTKSEFITRRYEVKTSINADPRLLQQRLFSAKSNVESECAFKCEAYSPWCEAFSNGLINDKNYCHLISRNDLADTDGETFDNVQDNPPEKMFELRGAKLSDVVDRNYVVQAVHNRAGFQDLTVIKPDGTECPAENSGIPLSPVPDLGLDNGIELVVRNGYYLYALGTPASSTVPSQLQERQLSVNGAIVQSSALFAEAWGVHWALDDTISWGDYHYWHSIDEKYPWFQLDFTNPTTVTSVSITTRGNCCGHVFINVVVSVGDTPMIRGQLSTNPVCATFPGPSAGGGTTEVLTCAAPMTGRFVVIQQTDFGVFHVNEVKINGNFLTGTGVIASASSESSGTWREEHLIDGNVNTVAHAALDALNPFFQIDFGSKVLVTRAEVVNRVDCCAERFKNAIVTVGNVPGIRGQLSANPQCGPKRDGPYSLGQTAEFICERPLVGRFVTLQLNGAVESLNIGEMRVFGKPPGQSLSGTLSSSSAFGPLPPENAVDLDITTRFNSKDEVHPWFQMEFDKPHMITQVWITSRSDGNFDKFKQVSVFVGGDPTTAGQLSTNPLCDHFDGPVEVASVGVQFHCQSPMIGKYVVVQVTTTESLPFAFGEIEVIGRPIEAAKVVKMDLHQPPLQWTEDAEKMLEDFQCCYGTAVVQNKIWLFGGKFCSDDFTPCYNSKIASYDWSDSNPSWMYHATELTNSGPMSAVKYSNGEVWIFDSLTGIEIFNPTEGTLTSKAGHSSFSAEDKGYTVSFQYVELDENTKGFIGVIGQKTQIFFYDINLDDWRDNVFDALPIGTSVAIPTRSSCLVAQSNKRNFYVNSNDQMFIGHGYSKSFDGPANPSPYDVKMGKCAAISKAFFPNC